MTVPIFSKENSDDLHLEAGEQSFPFQVTLPPSCPSSFYHPMGKINYSITGTIDIPWASDKHAEKSFTVINNIDLNILGPNIRQPREVEDSKNVLLSTGDPIVATFGLEKSKSFKIPSAITKS